MQSMLSGLLFLTVVVVVSSRVFFLFFANFFLCVRDQSTRMMLMSVQ